MELTEMKPGEFLLHGKTALVTGAARGIGLACAMDLGTRGARVLLFDVGDLQPALTALKNHGVNATGSYADVSRQGTLAHAIENLGIEQIDIAICAAGVLGRTTDLDTLDADELEHVLAVNLKGPIWTFQAVVPYMRRSGGAIVCIGSVAGAVGGLLSGVAYPASKGGLHAAVKWAARHLAPDRIRVNGVAPGTIDTEMIRGMGYNLSASPLGRAGTADEVAGAVSFLVSPAASYITGTILHVNGGLYMG